MNTTTAITGLRCKATVSGTEYGLMSHLPHLCDRPAKMFVPMRRFGARDVELPACGIHARTAMTTGRVYTDVL